MGTFTIFQQLPRPIEQRKIVNVPITTLRREAPAARSFIGATARGWNRAFGLQLPGRGSVMHVQNSPPRG